MNLWTPPYPLVRKISPFCSFQKDEATQINQKNGNARPQLMDDTKSQYSKPDPRAPLLSPHLPIFVFNRLGQLFYGCHRFLLGLFLK